MRRILFLLALTSLSLPLLAQRGGHGGGGGMHGGGGMRGGGVSRGGGSPAFRSGAGGFRGGGFRGGVGRRPVFRPSFGFRGFSRFGYYPYFYPGFYGGYGWYDSYPYDNSYYPYDNGYYPDSGYASGAPPVVINQDSSGYTPPPPPDPVMRYPPGPQLPQQQPTESSLYLIAFQDGVIRAVVAYWAEGSTLHYVTMDHEQKQAPLASVERALSERLNRERNVAFGLPR